MSFIGTRNLSLKDHVQVFTDGSKDPITENTGAASVLPSYRGEIGRRPSNCLSVLYAMMALEWVEQNKPNEVLVCTESVSALYSLVSGMASNRQHSLYEIMPIHIRIRNQGARVILILFSR